MPIHHEDEDDELFITAPTRGSRVVALANRVLFSRIYAVLYFFLIAANLALIVWIISDLAVNGELRPVSNPGFAVLEVFVNVFLVAEVTLRYVAMRERFFASWANRIDVAVVFVSVTALVFYFASSSLVEEAVTTVVVIFRYVIQLARLVVLIKNRKTAIPFSRSISEVDFSTLDDAPEVFSFVELDASREE